MKIWMDLLSTNYGMASLGVILFTLVMAVFFINMFQRNVKAEAEAAAKK